MSIIFLTLIRFKVHVNILIKLSSIIDKKTLYNKIDIYYKSTVKKVIVHKNILILFSEKASITFHYPQFQICRTSFVSP